MKNSKIPLSASLDHVFKSSATLIAIMVVLVSGCSAGEGSGTALAGDIGGSLKQFFVEPVKDSIIAIGEGTQVGSSYVNYNNISAQSHRTGNGKWYEGFDLTNKDLESCQSYRALGSDSRFSGVGGIHALANYFSWNSDRTIPLSYPGEFSYVSSFAYSCDVQDVLATISDLDVEALRAKDMKRETFVLSANAGEYSKATVSIDDSLIKGTDLQVMSLTRSTVESVASADALLQSWPAGDTTSDAGLQSFSRVFQGVSLEQIADQTGDDLRMSVAHGIYFEAAVASDDLSKYQSSTSSSPVVMKQKFTLVVSNSDRTWQGLAFFSSYKSDPACHPLEENGMIDYNRYKLTKSAVSDDLVCERDTGDEEVIETIYRDIPTDSVLFIAVVDKNVGSYTYREVCSGGHKIIDDYYDITECAIDDTLPETEYYGVDGRIVEDETRQKEMDSVIVDNVHLLLSQMGEYSRSQQFPAAVDSLGSLVSDVSDDTISHSSIESKEYASEQTKVQMDVPDVVSVVFDAEQSQIVVEWSYDTNDGSSERFHKIYRSDDKNNLNYAIKIADSNGSNYGDDDFVVGTQYYYWIRPCNSDGCSKNYSDAASISAVSMDAPATPQNITIETNGLTRSADISWDASPTASYYFIYRSITDNYSDKTKVARTKSSRHTDHGLRFENTYYYWAEACRKGSCSELAGPATAIIRPPVPKILAVSGISGDSEHYIKWTLVASTKSGTIKLYEVDISSDGDNPIATNPLTSASDGATNTDLTDGTTYYYKVRACAANNNCSVFSDVVSKTVVPSVPTIEKLEVTDRSGDVTTISFSWTTPRGTDSYKMSFSCNDGNEQQTIAEELSDNSGDKDVSGLPLRSSCSVAVSACNEGGCSGQSTAETVEIPVLSNPVLTATSTGLVVYMEWSEVPDAGSYNVYYEPVFDANNIPIDNVQEKNKFQHIVLSSGTHKFWVRACTVGAGGGGTDVIGCSLASKVVSLEVFGVSLNDTGIDRFAEYDSGSTPSFVKCALKSSGQDCELGRDEAARQGNLTKHGSGQSGFDFSRLNANGSNYEGDGQFSQSPWKCVRDNRTGLVWQVFDDHYTNAPSSTFADLYTEADMCGYTTGWRLPTMQELLSIARLDNANDAEATLTTLDPDYFPNDYDYDSSSAETRLTWTKSDATNDAKAWVIGNQGAQVYHTLDKSEDAVTRLVHSEWSDTYTNEWSNDRYVRDDTNNTVTDKHTGLMWSLCPLGTVVDLTTTTNTCATDNDNNNTSETMSWSDAISAVTALDVASHSDWRVPNIKELQSLVAYDRDAKPAMNSAIFPELTATTSSFWSSSPVISSDRSGDANVLHAFTTDFSDGSLGYSAVTASNYVYAVRTIESAQ